MAKIQQVEIKQTAVANSNPPIYEYHVTRLVNRLAPTVGTVLSAEQVISLMTEESTMVSVH